MYSQSVQCSLISEHERYSLHLCNVLFEFTFKNIVVSSNTIFICWVHDHCFFVIISPIVALYSCHYRVNNYFLEGKIVFLSLSSSSIVILLLLFQLCIFTPAILK